MSEAIKSKEDGLGLECLDFKILAVAEFLDKK